MFTRWNYCFYDNIIYIYIYVYVCMKQKERPLPLLCIVQY